MQLLRRRSVALVALLVLTLTGLGSFAHIVEHEHGLAELRGSATSSVSTADCDYGESLHVEAAETVELERCATCVLRSQSRADLERGATIGSAPPSTETLATASRDSRSQTHVRLRSSRAPPRA